MRGRSGNGTAGGVRGAGGAVVEESCNRPTLGDCGSARQKSVTKNVTEAIKRHKCHKNVRGVAGRGGTPCTEGIDTS